MNTISPETIAEMQKMKAEKTTIVSIAKKFNLEIHQVYKVLDYEKYVKNYLRPHKKKLKIELNPITEKIESKKRISQTKADAMAWIKKYYVESDTNCYSLSTTWNDYEYCFCNPVFKPMLSKSGYMKALIECGFHKTYTPKKKDGTNTNTIMFNLERRH